MNLNEHGLKKNNDILLLHPFLKTLLELAKVVSCIDPVKKIVDNKCANDCT